MEVVTFGAVDESAVKIRSEGDAKTKRLNHLNLESIRQNQRGQSQVGHLGGESRVSLEGAGFRSVRMERFECVEDVAMFAGLLGLMSTMGEVAG